jgi:ABC-type molybdate transport system substrate-binding protein
MKLAALVLTISLGLVACGPVSPKPAPQTLTVFAASSLTDAFTEIGKNFEAACLPIFSDSTGANQGSRRDWH